MTGGKTTITGIPAFVIYLIFLYGLIAIAYRVGTWIL